MTDDSDPIKKRSASEDYGPQTPCSECGDLIDEYSPAWTEYCHRHEEQRINPLIRELEALADEWERRYKENAEYPPYDIPAKELREVIADYE